MPRFVSFPLLLCLLVVLTVSGCGGSSSTGRGSGPLHVVAAENFWGNLAAQLGGDRVAVESIITNPNTDPHVYEPTASDARTVAGARLAIVNGAGYDAWAGKLLNASPASGRQVLDVGSLVGVASGGNPHRWYSPADVERVIATITSDLQRLDPDHAGYYAQRAHTLERTGLATYHREIVQIRARYAGVEVAASESIFAPLADALGLRLLTPTGFLNSVSEGSDPTAADKTEVDRQISSRQIKVWVYNSQNATPDIQRLNATARQAGIPIATVTETLTPAGASFEDWQTRQLRELAAALARATGR